MSRAAAEREENNLKVFVFFVKKKGSRQGPNLALNVWHAPCLLERGMNSAGARHLAGQVSTVEGLRSRV